jgi:hypothetical protein
LAFPNGETHRVLWGDGSSFGPDSLHPIPSSETFVNEILVESDGWYRPYDPNKTDIYNPFLPYFYVEGIGSIYTIFNHRGYYMAGFKSAAGAVMGKTYVVPTYIDENMEIPSSVVLFQNYPNPFNPSTRIRFHLSESMYVKGTVYDLFGRVILIFVDETLMPGEHSVRFDGSRIASGMYIYKIEANDIIYSKRMILIK